MRKKIWFAMVLGMSIVSQPAPAATASDGFPGVIPKPKEYQESGAPVLLARRGGTVAVECAGENLPMPTARQELARWLTDVGFHVGDAADGATGPVIRVGITDPAGTDETAIPDKAEGYVLSVRATGESVEIAIGGRDAMGAYYGVQTLLQLLDRTDEGVTVRLARVRDWPTFSFRSFKGQCWYYRDNRMFVDWASRYKWNVFGTCYTDGKDWRDPPPAYQRHIAEVCDAARAGGVLRIMQLGNPYMLKDKAIRATADEDIEQLARFFELSLSHGSDVLMLCLDDFAFLPQEDAGQFTNLAGANASIVTRFARRIEASHPKTRILVCPPPYWLDANRHKAYTWAHEYLREFSRSIPPEITIVWTGKEVTTVRHEAADIKAYQALLGPNRPLFLWDNTLKMPPGWSITFRMNPFLAACENIAGSAWPTMATFTHGEAVINTYGPGEIYKVPLMTAADYLWNPEAYDPNDSLTRALYWLDENHAVGPRVHHWVNDVHGELCEKRLAFLKAPTAESLAEIRRLTDVYAAEFEHISAATTNRVLIVCMEPYLRRHVDALSALEDMLQAAGQSSNNRAQAGVLFAQGKEKLTQLRDALAKGDIAQDRHGCVIQAFEKQCLAAIDTLNETLTKEPAR